jgi:hypothetical protein
LPCSGPHTTMEVLLEVVFSMWSTPRLYYWTNWFQLVQCSAAEQVGWWVSEWVSEWVRGLLHEAHSWGTGIIQKPRVRGKFAVGSRYQTTGEDIADWEDLCVL